MKIANIFFCVVFILFAALQYNDPDPYVWIPIYLFGAFICWQTARGRYFPRLTSAGIVVYAGYALYKFFCKDGVLDWIRYHHEENIAETMKATKPWIEETREFFGLIILIVVLLADIWYGYRNTQKTQL